MGSLIPRRDTFARRTRRIAADKLTFDVDDDPDIRWFPVKCSRFDRPSRSSLHVDVRGARAGLSGERMPGMKVWRVQFTCAGMDLIVRGFEQLRVPLANWVWGGAGVSSLVHCGGTVVRERRRE